ncbi:MAG: hypothetical protein C4542_09705 [Dehalococcoidia bacterium]|nr:MAG: hypothetical protein C4542_09705 [Dehalococcoidia bacterium]
MTQQRSYRVQRDGDDFLYLWDDYGIGVGVTQLYESHHDLYGQIVVMSTLPDQPGRLHKSRLNLDSARSRKTLVTELRTRVKEATIPWDDIFEVACVYTEEQYRAGPPVINLAQEGVVSQDYLVEPLLPEDTITILFGDGGVGKSYVSMMLALAVQTGSRLPAGLKVKRKTNVLYLDWESYKEDQVERFGSLLLGMNIDWPEAFWYRSQSQTIRNDASYLRAEVSRRDIGLVVIDSLGPASGGNLREEETAIAAMNALRSLGTTCLVLAHVAKHDPLPGANGSSRPTPLGSVMFQNLARSTWELRKSDSAEASTLQLGLYHRKSNRGRIEPRPIGLTFGFEGGIGTGQTLMVTPRNLDVGDVAELAARGSISFRLQSALREGARTTTELADELGCKEDTVYRVLRRRTDLFTLIEGGQGRGKSSMWGLLAVERKEAG